MTRRCSSWVVGLSLLMASGSAVAKTVMLPEYHPVATVIVSEDLFAMSRNAYEFGRQIINAGAELLIVQSQQYPYDNTAEYREHFGTKYRTVAQTHDVIWMRDFGPVPAVRDGRPMFLDLRFVSDYQFLESFPSSLGRTLNIAHQEVDLALDGGNILSDGKVCFLGDPRLLSPQQAKKAGKDSIKEALGCEQVVVLEGGPHEHIDMYVKLLPNDIALVASKASRTYFPWQKQLAKDLDSIAQQMGRYKKVRRIPLYVEDEGKWLTYANAILVNNHAIVPSYQLPEAEEIRAAEASVASAYESAGLTVNFVPADDIIQHGGAFHCVTVQIPRL